MRHKIFKLLSDLVYFHSGKVLIVSAIVTLLMMFASTNLKLRTELSDMLPEGIPQVEQYNSAVDQFTSTSTIMITVGNESGFAREEMALFATELADSIENIVYARPNDDASTYQKFSFFLEQQGLFEGESVLKFLQADSIPLDTTDLIDRIDLTMDKDFFEDHGFIIQKTKDLKSSIDMFDALTLPELIDNINDNFESEYTGDQENLASLDGEASAIRGIDGIFELLIALDEYTSDPDSSQAVSATDRFVSGDDYFYSPDNRMLVFSVQPLVTMDNYEEAILLTSQIKRLILQYREAHPGFDFGYAGALMLQQDEADSMNQDMIVPSIVSLLLIIFLLAGSFRTWKTPFLSVVTLIISIIWVTGVIALIFEFISIMTVFFALILIGLGIDFGIHFISGFRDGQELGKSVQESIQYMYDRTATGIITGASTTSIVFFTLAVTGFDAFVEMGISIGSGILVILLAMAIVLPALICYTSSDSGDSKMMILLKKCKLDFLISLYNSSSAMIENMVNRQPIKSILAVLEFKFIAKVVHYIEKPFIALIILVLAGSWAIFSATKYDDIRFEYDMMKLEPKGIISAVTQDSLISKYEMSPDFSLCLANDLEETRELVRKIKQRGDRGGLIGRVDAITEMLVSEEVQRSNVPFIEQFRDTLSIMEPSAEFTPDDQIRLAIELQRLHHNFIEMQDLQFLAGKENGKLMKKLYEVSETPDSGAVLSIRKSLLGEIDIAKIGEFQELMGTVLKSKLMQMSSPEIVSERDLSAKIRDRYISDSTGQNLITIYPNGNIWDEETMRKFNGDMETYVSNKVTGIPMVMQFFIDIMTEKGKLAVLLGVIAIFIFLFIDFRSIKDTLLAMIPLVIGVLWMIGFIWAFGLSFNMMNFMALPLIIGIGIDDGVHVLHRYNLEGRMSLEKVMRFTGRAILLTSLTTSIGFGSMALGTHRGMASMGLVLVIGVISCFITSAFVLTSLISLKKAIFKDKRIEIEE